MRTHLFLLLSASTFAAQAHMEDLGESRDLRRRGFLAKMMLKSKLHDSMNDKKDSSDKDDLNSRKERLMQAKKDNEKKRNDDDDDKEKVAVNGDAKPKESGSGSDDAAAPRSEEKIVSPKVPASSKTTWSDDEVAPRSEEKFVSPKMSVSSRNTWSSISHPIHHHGLTWIWTVSLLLCIANH